MLGGLQSDMQSRKRYCLDRELCCKYTETILHAANILINIGTKLTQNKTLETKDLKAFKFFYQPAYLRNLLSVLKYVGIELFTNC